MPRDRTCCCCPFRMSSAGAIASTIPPSSQTRTGSSGSHGPSIDSPNTPRRASARSRCAPGLNGTAGSGKSVLLSRPSALPGRRRFWQRLPWQFVVAIGGVVRERGDDHGVAHHVLRLNPLVDVLVRVVRARVVLDLVLNELKARKSNRIVRLVIRSTCVADRQRGHAHVPERLHPRLEDRRDGLVALEVDAANLPRAVVNV